MRAEEHDSRMKQMAEEQASRMKQIEQLLVRGAKMLVSNQEANRDTDRRISALLNAQLKTEQKLVETDGRISALVDAQLKTEQKLAELAEAQKTTEQKLQNLLDSLGKSSNGH